jgi:exodeoxyribonuclease VII large subunit
MASLFDLPFEHPEREPSKPAQPPAAAPAPAPRAAAPLTVSELTADIRSALESGFPDVLVEGELSNCKKWHTGHVYFTLKDSAAQIRAVMFRSAVRSLKFTPEDGVHVIARGRVTVYDAKGEYQFICERLEPRGLGALQLAFDQLRKKLEAEGLFAAERKRPLPVLPRRIGVVTSLDGAAIRDILSVLGRRYPNASILIRPARVQGEGAARDIARGIAAIGRVPDVDVIIVGRGGGSIEDLWAFNEEVVARAIVAAPVPVISAVGHETDTTIADFVADLRAPTPSAAAETVVAKRDEFCGRIDRLEERVRGAVKRRVLVATTRVHALESRRGLARVPATLAMRGRHVEELLQALRHAERDRLMRVERQLGGLARRLERRDPREGLAAARGRLSQSLTRLAAGMRRRDAGAHSALGTLAGRLHSLSPLAVLGRGYAVCWNEDRTRIIRSATDVHAGDDVRVTLAEGELDCKVKHRRDA